MSIYTLYIVIGLYMYIYIYGCPSQNTRSGTRSGTTPVPYPRSIPPFHTCLKDPFHTSVPYLFHTSDPYLIIYLCTFEHVQSDFTCVCKYMNTLYIHEYIPARLRLLCPSPVIELASLCYACSCYLLC